MFSLKNTIEDYAAISPAMTALEAGEFHQFSFHLTTVSKASFGYRRQPNSDYLAHVTNQRLLLEPVDPKQPLLSIPHAALQKISLSRSLKLSTAVSIKLNCTIANLSQRQLYFIAAKPGENHDHIDSVGDQCSSDFVTLTNLLLNATENALTQALKGAKSPVVAYFWAKGCKPCEAFSPTVESLGKAFQNQAQFLKLNMDDDPALSLLFGVDCVPSLLVFKAGKLVEKIDGAIPEAIATKVVAHHLMVPESV